MSIVRIILEEFLPEALLSEEVALTKGSQAVLNNKKLVAELANAIRDDAQVNPSVFTRNVRDLIKMPDEQLARWFLENLDTIEKTGYEGTVYSKDGVNSEWIVRRYIAGSHSWEDIIGVLNLNLRDWYILKRRNLLEPRHQDLWSFKSIREVGSYVNKHYEQHMKDIRLAAAREALKKQSKTAKIVDNDDYKIYTVFNWAGARTLGLGTQWCTANSESDLNYRNYSNRAMLFQMYPKNPENIEKSSYIGGKEVRGLEKYQFDAGTPTINDLADHVVDKKYFQEKYPYVYTDLVRGLKAAKPELQAAIDKMKEDPTLQTKETRIQPYNVDEEIKKLKILVDRGWFTDKKRPSVSSGEESEEGSPQIQAPQNQGSVQMENTNNKVKSLLDSLKYYEDLLEDKTKSEVCHEQVCDTIKESVDKKEESLEQIKHSMNKGLTEVTDDERFNKSMRKMTGQITPDDAKEYWPSKEYEPINLDPSYLPLMNKWKQNLLPLVQDWYYINDDTKLNQLGWQPELGDDYALVILRGIDHDGHIQYTADDLGIIDDNDDEEDITEKLQADLRRNRQGIEEGSQEDTWQNYQGPKQMKNTNNEVKTLLDSLKYYEDLLEDKTKSEIQCEVCHEQICECETMEESVDKSKIPAIQRKKSGDKNWKLTQDDLDKEEEKKMSSKKGLEKLKKDTGIVEADSDVRAMLESLKKYDTLLKESVAPVLERRKDVDEESMCEACHCDPCKCDDHKHIEETTMVDEEDMEEGNEFSGALAKAKAAGHDEFEVGGKKYKVKEEADPEVLEWMQRFSKLGR